MADYQLAHDGFGGRAYSGVLSGGKFIACAAGNADWDAYVKWLAEDPKNKPKPWKSPEDGGEALSPKDGDVVTGSMLWSIPKFDPDSGPAPYDGPIVWSHTMLNEQPEQHPASRAAEHHNTTGSGSAGSSQPRR